MTKTNKKLKEVTIKANGLNTGPVRFTYVLYENQRRWLGVGWTPNLLSYERTPWTDEFLNESESPENFELPQLNDDTGMYWRWVDKTWRLDLTNDGALQLPSSKSKTVADPKSDDGYIYYDNTWKNPTTEDSFSKYTRRRRWIRTAELVSPNDDDDDDNHTDETDDVNTTDVSNVPLQQSSSSINSFPGPKVSHSSLTDIQNVTAIGTSTSASASASTSTSGSEILQNSSNSKPSKRKSLRFDKTPTILEHEDEKKSVPESVIDDGTVDEIDDVGPVDVKLD
ncbi:hypothetical protein CANARDRAFT_29970 [[Candida] arabinofermentans NRRL YB-2248]|uniref:Peroxin/Ferlin domain-containing protein n=1 Tax=[Candida] arabinofermentans NRRL YB-2248 TaxID=983967 RepID=A0A1E4SVS9_9ASCO|nr:hypothetical protein CANARDRAFT_29970 [[Candida] arabinofermentans NRRL YB-2248]